MQAMVRDVGQACGGRDRRQREVGAQGSPERVEDASDAVRQSLRQSGCTRSPLSAEMRECGCSGDAMRQCEGEADEGVEGRQWTHL